MSDKALPDWVKVGKKRFDRLKVQNVQNDNLQTIQFGKFINFIESNKLIQEIACGKITCDEALERIISIPDDIDKIISQEKLTPNQGEVLSILFMVN